MTMREFLKENRELIDTCIRGVLDRPNSRGERGAPTTLNDRERRLWVLNDEGLYRWARKEEVLCVDILGALFMRLKNKT